jgi:AmiR/NasT family two-component response regulator
VSNDARANRLRVLAADEDEAALAQTARILEALGHDVRACAASVSEAIEVIARDDLDAAVVVVHEDVSHALDLIEEISEASSGPVVAMLHEPSTGFVEAAAERGISAVASPGRAEELQAALEVAMRRHAEAMRLSEQVGQLEHALARRAMIERAKGMLMERHGLSEREAFEALRAHARSRSRQVVAVARDVAEGGLDLPGAQQRQD